MELSKQDTLSIKGLAICLMLWHHLFLNTLDFGSLAHSLAQVFKVCVALFLFVSGYGLTKQYARIEKPYVKNTIKFLLRRYVGFFLPYWFCFVLVIAVGSLCGYSLHEAYPASRNVLKCFALDFLGQMGYDSYLKTWWFNKLIIQLYVLFPLLYVVVNNKYSAIIGAVAVLALQLTHPIPVFCLEEGGMPAFFLGMIMARYPLAPSSKSKLWKNLWLGISVVACVALAILHQWKGVGSYGAVLVRAFLAFSMVCVYRFAPKSSVFGFFGKYATILYLIHTLFLILIPNVIYGAKLAPLVFVVFMAFSLAAAVLLDWLQKMLRYDRLKLAILNQIDKRI